jgi:predicted AAA+ superfamily ATPase
LLRPWIRNVSSSLRKEPKWYVRDWSAVDDAGKRFETFVACHLLKAVQGWTDLGLGDFELRYLRDKQQREVDFVVVRDGKPWFLVEAKHRDTRLSPALQHFQEMTQAPHAFQVVEELPYVDANPYTHRAPMVVPARTLLSQWI